MPPFQLARRALTALVLLASAASGQAQEKFSFLTNWYAEAEHGGFYQALATGLYKQAGLDVTLRMGGPQQNPAQLLLAELLAEDDDGLQIAAAAQHAQGEDG